MAEQKSINVEKLKEHLGNDSALRELVFGAMQIYLQVKLVEVPEGTIVFLKELEIIGDEKEK